jgi:hypothetical protein
MITPVTSESTDNYKLKKSHNGAFKSVIQHFKLRNVKPIETAESTSNEAPSLTEYERGVRNMWRNRPMTRAP